MEKRNMRRNIKKMIAAIVTLALLLMQVSCQTAETQPIPSPTPFVPNIDAFTVGTIDETGYSSAFFGFGIRLPEEWLYYAHSDIDGFNHIQTDPADPKAHDQEIIDLIKSGNAPYEYFAGNDLNGESITIYIKDYSDYSDFQLMEYVVLDDQQGWLYDSNSDSQDDIGNLSLEVVDLLGVEHPIYRYDNIADGFGNRGAFLAIKQGTTFALILIYGVDDNAVDDLLDGFYSLNTVAQDD